MSGLAKAAASADVILITKPLRMDWTDALALDARLSHVAFRVACIIGFHFNKNAGDTFVKQDTIARVAGLCPRTVRNAIGELETLGYILVRRRELGTRADGRRVCGGKGIANTYLPALDKSQVAATSAGTKLAERAKLAWTERTAKRRPKEAPGCHLGDNQRRQNPAAKEAPGCLPTLNLPTEGNPTALSAGPCQGPASERLKRRLGDAVFASWFGRVRVGEIAGDTFTLVAPTRFIRDHIATHLIDDVLFAWQAERPEIRRVVVVTAQGSARSAAPSASDGGSLPNVGGASNAGGGGKVSAGPPDPPVHGAPSAAFGLPPSRFPQVNGRRLRLARGART